MTKVIKIDPVDAAGLANLRAATVEVERKARAEMYVKVQIHPGALPEGNYYVVPLRELDLSDLEEFAFGTGYLVTRIEITDDEYEALPEFEGI